MTKYLPAILLLLFSGTVLGQPNQSKQADSILREIENFEAQTLGMLPIGWYNQKGDKQPYTYTGKLREGYMYSIAEEAGNKFLRYEGGSAKHLTYPLADKSEINIHETPILSWKWRVHELPKGANEKKESINDAAASIYVAFDLGRVALFKKVPKSIRYTWSSSLKEGEEFSKFFGNQKVVVVASGEDELGKWIQFERNIYEDYKRLFGKKPPKTPLAILILSDANSTGSYAKADYDDIVLKAASSSN